MRAPVAFELIGVFFLRRRLPGYPFQGFIFGRFSFAIAGASLRFASSFAAAVSQKLQAFHYYPWRK
jgi:hypothetical protein